MWCVAAQTAIVENTAANKTLVKHPEFEVQGFAPPPSPFPLPHPSCFPLQPVIQVEHAAGRFKDQKTRSKRGFCSEDAYTLSHFVSCFWKLRCCMAYRIDFAGDDGEACGSDGPGPDHDLVYELPQCCLQHADMNLTQEVQESITGSTRAHMPVLTAHQQI